MKGLGSDDQMPADGIAHLAHERLGYGIVYYFQLLEATGASIRHYAIGNKVVEVNVQQFYLEAELVILRRYGNYRIITLVVEFKGSSEDSCHNSFFKVIP